MKKNGNSDGFLAVASRSIPAESRLITLPPFKKGMKVRLASTQFLSHAYQIVGETFPKGEIGEVIGQSEQNLVVCFAKENWVVSPSKLRPLNNGTAQRKKRI